MGRWEPGARLLPACRKLDRAGRAGTGGPRRSIGGGVAGGGAAASALVKVAIVQPLFREVLETYDPTAPDAPNLYAFFRAFWFRLPAEVHTAMPSSAHEHRRRT